jgi:hypothetical protein
MNTSMPGVDASWWTVCIPRPAITGVSVSVNEFGKKDSPWLDPVTRTLRTTEGMREGRALGRLPYDKPSYKERLDL